MEQDVSNISKTTEKKKFETIHEEEDYIVQNEEEE